MKVGVVRAGIHRLDEFLGIPIKERITFKAICYEKNILKLKRLSNNPKMPEKERQIEL